MLDAKKEVAELERKSALPALEHMPDFTAIAPAAIPTTTRQPEMAAVYQKPAKPAQKRPIFNFDWEREEWEAQQKFG